MTFASTTARNTALSGVLDEGMVAYLEDTNSFTFYEDGAWEILVEAPQTWNLSTITQSGSVAVTTDYGWYQRRNKIFTAHIAMTINASGTTANDITVAVPLTLANVEAVGGSFSYLDQGVGYYAGSVVPSAGTTSFKLAHHGGAGLLGQSFAMASTDVLRITLHGRY
jgi:hypothetical protein